jgi:hypothetical protein
VKAVLVVFTIKVGTPQLEDLAVIPPQKATNDNVHEVTDDDVGPKGGGGNLGRRDDSEPLFRLVVDLGPGGCHMDGDEDAAADESADNKHVAAHSSKSEEKAGVEAGAVDEFVFGHCPQRLKPRPQLLSYRRRRVSLVCVFELGGVYSLVIGAEKGETYGNEDGEPEGYGQGRP